MTASIPTAKTIQIYLPKGNPRGLRLAEMTTRTVRLIEIPRIHIDDFFAMREVNQVGLYFWSVILMVTISRYFILGKLEI